jgi:AAA domain
MTFSHKLPPDLEALLADIDSPELVPGGNQHPKSKSTPPEPFTFDPAPYIPPDAAKIPRREWLYGKYYIRGVVSATLGAPGRLKSTMEMTDAISMATGLDLMDGKKPLKGGALRVAYINGEENQDELDRRFAAICQRYGLKPEDCQGRIWIISTRDKPLRLAVAGKGGNGVIAEEVVSALEAWCDKNRLDVVMFDPVVSFHRVRENDPGDMDMLYKEGFGRVAGKTRAVDLAIHPRKPAPGALNTTMDDLRGTGAQEGAIRAARIFNFMTAAEAEQLKITAGCMFGSKVERITPAPLPRRPGSRSRPKICPTETPLQLRHLGIRQIRSTA